MTEPTFLESIRTAYNLVADDYAEFVRDALDASPLSRALLGTFAELVLAADLGPVGDLGCTPTGTTSPLDAYRLPPGGIAELLTKAGFAVQVRVVREPEGMEKVPQAFLLARTPLS